MSNDIMLKELEIMKKQLEIDKRALEIERRELELQKQQLQIMKQNNGVIPNEEPQLFNQQMNNPNNNNMQNVQLHQRPQKATENFDRSQPMAAYNFSPEELAYMEAERKKAIEESQGNMNNNFNQNKNTGFGW